VGVTSVQGLDIASPSQLHVSLDALSAVAW
jgi:hypothetical protein